MNGKFDGEKFYNAVSSKFEWLEMVRPLSRQLKKQCDLTSIGWRSVANFEDGTKSNNNGKNNNKMMPGWVVGVQATFLCVSLQVGSFRMMMDMPPIPSTENNNDGDVFLRGTHHHHDQYDAHRRERRQTGIVKKNYYELLTPSQGRLSPLGRIAQTMMKQVLKAKGKAEKDVVP